MGKLYEKTTKTTSIFKGKVIDLQVDDVLLPNGNTSTRELVKHPGAVAIVALTESHHLLLVEQFRKPLDRTIFEIPAGKLEKGENPLECAKRELKEETGYTCREMKHLVSFYTSPGFADELIHIYFTDSLISGELKLDDDEFLENHEVDLERALQMMKDEKICDAKTVYAVQYLQLLNHITGIK